MANTSIFAAFERMWQHVVAALGGKADINHNHDDKYYTEVEVDTKLSAIDIPVQSVNSKTGAVSLSASDVGAPTVAEMNAAIAAIPTPDVSSQINTHNTSTSAHSDIRTAINNKAPMYSYGTADLNAGVSELEDGKLYFVYE